MSVNILRYKPSLTFTTSGTTAVSATTQGYECYGFCPFWRFVVPSFASTTPTMTMQVWDPDGNVIWQAAGVTQGTTYQVTGGTLPFVGGETFYCTLSAIPSGAGPTINVPVTIEFYMIID